MSRKNDIDFIFAKHLLRSNGGRLGQLALFAPPVADVADRLL